MTTPRRLVEGSQLGTAVATFYTAPENTRTRILLVTVTNTTSTPQRVTLHLVAPGGTANAANMVTSARSVGVGAPLVLSEAAHNLEAGGSIQAFASAAAALTLVASGVEFS
jgi:hypothetical protein